MHLAYSVDNYLPSLSYLKDTPRTRFDVKENIANHNNPTATTITRHDLEGYFFRRHKRVFNGQWMTLDFCDKKILCFEDSSKCKECGSIDLTAVRNLQEETIKGNPGFILEMVNGKSIRLYTISSETRDEWAESINELMDKDNTNSQSFVRRFLLGLNMAIRSEQHPPNIVPFDYDRSVIHCIRRSGMSTVYLEEYAPSIFSDIRKAFGVTQSDLLPAWDLPSNMMKLSTLEVDKSSCQFLFSSDKRYILKFIDAQEKKIILQTIMKYHQDISENPNCLLMRLYGIFTYQSHSRTVMMMNNWIQGYSDMDISKVLLSSRVFSNLSSGFLTPTSSYKKIFGVTLDMVEDLENQVPLFIISAMNRLISDAQQSEQNPYSLFAREPEDIPCLLMNKSILENEIHSLQEIPDTRMIAGLLMTYFKDFTNPLVPKKLFTDMLAAQEIGDPQCKLTAFHYFVTVISICY